MSINDITGDSIISKIPTDKYRDNYDMIFRKKSEDEILIDLVQNDEKVNDVLCNDE